MTIIELIEAVAARRVQYVEAIQYLKTMRITQFQRTNAARYLRAAYGRINLQARKAK